MISVNKFCIDVLDSGHFVMILHGDDGLEYYRYDDAFVILINMGNSAVYETDGSLCVSNPCSGEVSSILPTRLKIGGEIAEGYQINR